MTRDDYISAVSAIFEHDAITMRIRDASRALAISVGDDFGGIAIVPETPLRRAYIDIVAKMAGDETGLTAYFIAEVIGSKMGEGEIEKPSGDSFIITDAGSAFDAIRLGF